MIDPYTDFRVTDEGSVVARNEDGAVRIAAKWTTPEVAATAVRLAVPGGGVETTDEASLAAPREESIAELAETADEEDRPLVPSERHAAAVLDYLVDSGHAAREGDTYYFHPPGGESTGLGYAGALYSVADAIGSTADAIDSVEAAVDENAAVDADDQPEAFLEAQRRLGDLSEQRRQLSTAAERIRSNGRTIETAVLEQATLDQLDFEAVDTLVDAVDTLATTVESGAATETDPDSGSDEDASSGSDEDASSGNHGAPDEGSGSER